MFELRLTDHYRRKLKKVRNHGSILRDGYDRHPRHGRRPQVIDRTRIAQALLDANGRTRSYGCDWDDVLQALDEALQTGSGHRSGGYIQHPSAYSKRGRLPVITEVDAKRISRHHGILLVIDGRAKTKGLVPWRVALRLTSERRAAAKKEAAAALAGIPSGIPVTAEDSIHAGNCPQETARVAGWFHGQSEIDSGKLARVVAQRAPHLLSFVKRAVETAQKRKEN